jgi:hypothetical protein
MSRNNFAHFPLGISCAVEVHDKIAKDLYMKETLCISNAELEPPAADRNYFYQRRLCGKDTISNIH